MGKQYQPRTATTSSMARIGILALAITAFVTVVTPECCIQKNYGGEMYTLRGPEDMQEYPCKDGCYYTKDGMPGSRFCFKKGGPIMSTCDISMCTLPECYPGSPCCDPVTPPCTVNECSIGAPSPVAIPTPTPAPAPGPGCIKSDCFFGNPCCDPLTPPCTVNECLPPPAPVPAPVPAGCTNNDCKPGNACCDNGTPPCNDNPQCGGGSGSGSGCSPGDCFPGNPCCDPVTSPCTDSECFPPAPVPAPVSAPMGMGDHGSGGMGDHSSGGSGSGCTNSDCTPGTTCCEEGLPPCDQNPECGNGPPAPVPTPVPAPVPAPMGMGDHGSDGMGDHSSDGMGDHSSGGMDGGMGMGDHGRK